LTSDLITEKLSFQVKSFQESFELLSNENSLSGMSKHFEKILRGNFFTTEISVYHKLNSEASWSRLISKNGDQHNILIEKEKLVPLMISSNQEATVLYTTINLIDSSFLGIVLGAKFDKTTYKEMEKITFQIFLQIFDSAYQVLLSHGKEKKLIFSLNNRISQLYSLIDTGIEISKKNVNDQLFELALARSIALTNSSYGRIKIINDVGIVRQIFFPPNIKYEDTDKEKTMAQKFIDEGNEYEFSLCEKESREGIIKFDETDELLLGAITRQVQAAIENERYHREALENETMRRELAVAAEIQMRILPEKLPSIDEYDIAGLNIPSKGVSGDYYNVFKLADSRYALILGDVTGKGMPASLLVSTLDASLRSYLDFQIPLSEMALKMNTVIYNSSTADKFITFFIAVLDPESGELDIINAGHNPALILRQDQTMEKIDAGGVAFGMFDMGLPFDSQKLVLEKGERLFIFSDGIPEAMDKDEEEYTDERMEKYFIDVTPNNAGDFIKAIVSDVKAHTNGETQSDDITALYLIRK
jgi:serine phosphatase RsbU (regulator of sigma subunit)